MHGGELRIVDPAQVRSELWRTFAGEVLDDPALGVVHAEVEVVPVALDDLEHPVARIAALLADGGLVPALVLELPTKEASALPAHEPARRDAVVEACCPQVDEAGGLLDRGPARLERPVHRQPGSRHVEGPRVAVLVTTDVWEVGQQRLEALERLPGDRLPLRLAVDLDEVLPVVAEGEPHLPHDLGLVLEVPALGCHAVPPFTGQAVTGDRVARQPTALASSAVASSDGRTGVGFTAATIVSSSVP